MRVRRRALSLVEILIALVILSMSLIPLVLLFQMGGSSSRSGERELVALLFAHEVLEVMRAELDTWTADADQALAMPNVQLTPPKGFSYRLEVRPVEKGLDTVGVVVTWKERRKDRKTRLDALVSRRGARIPHTGIRARMRRRR